MVDHQSGSDNGEAVGDHDMIGEGSSDIGEPDRNMPGRYTLEVLRSLSELRPGNNWHLYTERMTQLDDDTSCPALASFILANYPQFRRGVPAAAGGSAGGSAGGAGGAAAGEGAGEGDASPAGEGSGGSGREREIHFAALEPIIGADLLEATLQELLAKYTLSESEIGSAGTSKSSSPGPLQPQDQTLRPQIVDVLGRLIIANSGFKMWAIERALAHEQLLPYFEGMLDCPTARSITLRESILPMYRQVLGFVAVTLRNPARTKLKRRHSEMPRLCTELLRVGLAPRMWHDIRELMVAWLEERAMGARLAAAGAPGGAIADAAEGQRAEPFQVYLAREFDAWFQRLYALAQVLAWLDGVLPSREQESRFRILALGMLSKYVLLDTTVFRKIVSSTAAEADRALTGEATLLDPTGTIIKVVLVTVPLDQQRQLASRVAASTAAKGAQLLQAAADERGRADQLLRTLCDTFATWARAAAAAWYQLRLSTTQVGAEALLMAQLRVLTLWLPSLAELFGEALVHNNLGAVTALFRLVADFSGSRKLAHPLLAHEIGRYMDAVHASDLSGVGKGRVLERVYALVARAVLETPQGGFDMVEIMHDAIAGAHADSAELQVYLAEFGVFEAVAIAMLGDVSLERRQQAARRLQHACAFATSLKDSSAFESAFFWRFAHALAPRREAAALRSALSDDVIVEALGPIGPETILALRVMATDLEVSLCLSHMTGADVSVCNQTNWPLKLADDDHHGVVAGPHALKAHELAEQYQKLYKDRVAKLSPSLSTVDLTLRNRICSFRVETTLAQEAVIRHLAANGVATLDELRSATQLSALQLKQVLEDLVDAAVSIVLWQPAAQGPATRFAADDSFGLNPVARPVRYAHAIRVEEDVL